MMSVFNRLSSALRTARRARSAGSIYRRGTPPPARTSPGPVQQTDQIAASRDLSLIVKGARFAQRENGKRAVIPS
jgi:hypothetical protein